MSAPPTNPPPSGSQAFVGITHEQLVTSMSNAIAQGDTQRSDILLTEIRARMVADQTMIATMQNMQNATAKALSDTTKQLQTTATVMQKSQASTRHAHATLSMDSVKMEKPPQFDGTPSKLSNFRFRVQQYVKIVGLVDPVKQQQFASSLLVGKALTWWRAQCDVATKSLYPVDLLTTMTVNSFFKELQQAFHDVDHENRLRQRFNSLQQTSSVQSYIAAFRGIIVDLGDDAPTTNDQLWHFVRGLKYQVGLNVRLQRPKTLDEAMELAETTDSAIFEASGRGKSQYAVHFGGNKRDNKGKNKQRVQYPDSYHGPMPMDIDFLK